METRNILFAAAALAANIIVPLPQTECSKLTGGSGLRNATGSHFIALKFFI